jgi:hypothetical protein
MIQKSFGLQEENYKKIRNHKKDKRRKYPERTGSKKVGKETDGKRQEKRKEEGKEESRKKRKRKILIRQAVKVSLRALVQLEGWGVAQW